MGPKKGKDAIDENYWRRCIEEAILDEETWKVKVIMIEAAGSDQDRIYLNKFENFAAGEKRFVIKNICKTETIFMVNQLGGEKKVKDDNLRVFEEGNVFIKDKKEIPADILALIIKYLILKMKDEYLFIKRQRLELKEGMRRESATMLDRAEVRGTINVKSPEPEPTPPVKGKKKNEDTSLLPPEPAEGKKYNTMLRERGEEWRDKVYVDDFPTDGPNLYIAVTGFVEPNLPACLVQIGIPLTAIVQVRIDPTTTKVPSTLFRPTKRGQSQTELLLEKALKFWEDIQLLRIHVDSAHVFKNTAFVVFSPPYWDTDKLTGDPDKIYDEICFLMYDLQDLSRQHVHYLDNMDIINIPLDEEEVRLKKFYMQQINDMPLECVTVFSVLDSILRGVTEGLEENSKTSLLSAVTMNQSHKSDSERIDKAENLARKVFSTLCITDANKKAYRVTYGEEYESHKNPIIINYGDSVKYPNFHLGNINLDNIVWSTLLGMPIHKLWQGQDKPRGELEAKINFHVNVILSCFDREDVETTEFNRLMHILACRKLYNNRSSLRKQHLPSTTITEFKKVYLKRSILAEPLPKCPSLVRSCSNTARSFPSMTKSDNISDVFYGDDPESQRIRFLFDCPDISELISAAELVTEKPISHMIDDFELFEDFAGTCAFQVMLDAFNKFNCVDYKYCEVTDCFILMFFNSFDKDGVAREEWRSHLPTPLCLQDFFDFVLEERYDWIQNEEKIYDENVVLKSQSECKDLIDPFALKSCVENTDVEMDLLMEGSLKHQDIIAAEEPNEDVIDIKAPSRKSVSAFSTGVESKPSRYTKSPATSTPKGKSIIIGLSRHSSTQIIPKVFSGYDLGDRRVEVFGKDATYFSRDGTFVSSKYTLTIPMNLEYIVLNVVPGNGCNEFWVHKSLGEFVRPDLKDSSESFRVTSKDKVLYNLMKRSYQIPIVRTVPSTVENVKTKEALLKSVSKVSDTLPNIFETKIFHSVYITWPNGLITESIHEEQSSAISHIKQYHTTPMPHLDEDMRCISLKGEVIIFRKSGDIEVLRPDGSYFIVLKCFKKIVIPDVPEELMSETSSTKSKKGKNVTQERSAAKMSKASSKSSKINTSDVPLEVKEPDYELIIEEFEVIETSGLRQKWINNVPFDIEKLLIRTATDYCLGEIFSRRMDGTSILLNKDGLQVVTFHNNTRIVTEYVIEEEEIYPEWTEEAAYFDMLCDDTIDTERKNSMSQKSYTYTSGSSTQSKKIEEEQENNDTRYDGYISVYLIITIEHANFTTVTVNQGTGKVSVDSPNDTTVVIDSNNHYDFNLGNGTTAKFNGENLHITYEACPECRSYTTCNVRIKPDEVESMTKLPQSWLKMRDSFCNKIIVNEEGSISVLDEPCSEELLHGEETGNVEEATETGEDRPTDMKSEISVTSHSKCREMYMAKTIKFFVLHRDLTCAELVHKVLLEQYKQTCRWQPWCSISQYNTFGDHRSLVSLLTPIHLTESEKWLMDSKLANKPKYLTYKDLKKDCGKGFYHWMRPYERFVPTPIKPENVLPPRLPRAFVLRTLEQQWGDSEREDLKGAKELLVAILRYRRAMEADKETLLHIPILDPRMEDERRIDDIIQALAHRIYEELKLNLQEDVQSRAKATITTRPPPIPEEMSVEGEIEEAEDEAKALEEERSSLIRQMQAAHEPSANLQRYWRRRNEEYKEEQFYKYLLREGVVPPYFKNVLGGAIWWDMNSAAEDAVTTAERNKMKCICAEEGTSKTDETPYM